MFCQLQPPLVGYGLFAFKQPPLDTLDAVRFLLLCPQGSSSALLACIGLVPTMKQRDHGLAHEHSEKILSRPVSFSFSCLTVQVTSSYHDRENLADRLQWLANRSHNAGRCPIHTRQHPYWLANSLQIRTTQQQSPPHLIFHPTVRESRTSVRNATSHIPCRNRCRSLTTCLPCSGT